MLKMFQFCSFFEGEGADVVEKAFVSRLLPFPGLRLGLGLTSSTAVLLEAAFIFLAFISPQNSL